MSTVVPVHARINGRSYLLNGKFVIWWKDRWLCEHRLRPSKCEKCKQPIIKTTPIEDRVEGGSYTHHGKRMLWINNRWHCMHGVRESVCRECGGNGICEHGKYKGNCRTCCPWGFCAHARKKATCKICIESGCIYTVMHKGRLIYKRHSNETTSCLS